MLQNFLFPNSDSWLPSTWIFPPPNNNISKYWNRSWNSEIARELHPSLCRKQHSYLCSPLHLCSLEQKPSLPPKAFRITNSLQREGSLGCESTQAADGQGTVWSIWEWKTVGTLLWLRTPQQDFHTHSELSPASKSELV